VVEEEADESAFWLELIMEHGLLIAKRVIPLRVEAAELTAVTASSRISAARNAKQSPVTKFRPVSNSKSPVGNLH
jgi:hypothetical protein